MPTSIQRKYYVTTFDELSTIPLKEGNVIALSDTDGLYYDIGNPSGSGQSVVRRKASAIEYVETLADARHERDTIFVVKEDDLTVGYCWNEDSNEFVTVFNDAVVVDREVESAKLDPWETKAYLVASEQEDTWTGTLVKNADIYITTTGKIHADIDGSATTATSANTAITATSATSALKDSGNHTITDYYLHDVSSNAVADLGSALTFTLGNGDTKVVRVSDHIYSTFTDAIDGLVPAASDGTPADLILTGTGWEDKADISVGSADVADSATEDSLGNDIASTYYADVSYTSGVGLTLTSADGNTTKTVSLPISSYSVFNPSTDGLVPAPSGSGETNKFLKGDGTWDSVPVSTYTGADASTAGVAGSVPPAAAGQMNRFLRGDATWGTTFSVGNDGLVPAPTSNDVNKYLKAVSDGQGGITGEWVDSGVDTKNTAGATQVIPETISFDDLYEGDGVTRQYSVSHTLLEVTTITLDDVATSAYTADLVNGIITFTTAPGNGVVIKVTYQTYNFNEVLYLVGAKSQDPYPQTFTDGNVYIKSSTLYSQGFEVVDLYSSQDLYNKTFGGQSLGTAAFKKADSSVTITEVTMTDTFSADGTETDFTTSYSMLSLTNIVVSEVVSASSSFTGDGTTTAFALTDTIITITSVTIDGSATSAYIFDLTNNAVVFDTAPANGSAIVINYSKYQTITTPAYTVNTGTSTVSFTTAPDAGDKIDITYKANDPTYDSTNVPTNQAVITYTNSRINTVQDDLTRRVPTSMVAATYDSTATYAVGDYCIYDNGSTTDLYVCNTLIASSEPWTLAHWTKVILTDRLDLHHYSGTERVAGTWKDGKVLYEQTITISNITTGSTQTVSHGITFDKIFIAEGFTEYSISSDSYFGTISAYNTSADNEQFCVKIGDSSISYNAGTNLSGGTAYLTVRYTKPST